MQNDSDVLSQAHDAESFCLAIVSRTWGSAPRGVGSLLAVFGDGGFAGSVSGGCIEASVIADSMEAMQLNSRVIQRKEFGISDESAWEAGLACGGTIQILILPIMDDERRNLIRALSRALKNNQSAHLAVMAEEESLALWVDGRFHAGDSSLAGSFDSVLNFKKSQVIESHGKEILLCYYPKPRRLIILGAVHIATHLAPMAAACGMEVHIIDPRPAWLNRPSIESLPAQLHQEWSDEALQKLKIDEACAFVALTHDPKIDDAAFNYLSHQEKNCFYMGALGSSKTHNKRCHRLKQAGVKSDTIAAIHAPIGLNIGATNPAEIAVAILAQIIDSLN